LTEYLLDTNVVSELAKSRPSSKVIAFIAAQPLDTLFVSSVTMAEIRYGIETIPDVSRRVALNDWLANIVRPMFAGRILPISEDVMLKWRLIVEGGRKAGYTFSQPDLIIAATGIHHGLTIVTRNTADFSKTTATLFNPWTDHERD
jgi:predicted nucleic acid-binding protein